MRQSRNSKRFDTGSLCDRQPECKERGKRRASIDPPGYDAGKKIKGKKRHILVDTLGLMLHAIVHPADIQDRDGGSLVLNTLFGRFPFLTKLFADGGYQGRVFATAAAHAMPGLSVEIMKRSDTAKGFEVIPKRWVVERGFGWFGRSVVRGYTELSEAVSASRIPSPSFVSVRSRSATGKGGRVGDDGSDRRKVAEKEVLWRRG